MISSVTATGTTATGNAACSTSGTDYVNPGPIAGTLANGSGSHTVTAITICPDTTTETDETIVIQWGNTGNVFDSSAANCISGASCTTTITIIDEDRPQNVSVDWPLKPSAIGAGDSFRLMFITSTTTAASSTDMRYYNDVVQGRAFATLTSRPMATASAPWPVRKPSTL